MSGHLSRRDFLKQAAVTAGAAAASGLTGSMVSLAHPPAQEMIPLRAMTIGGPARAETFEAVIGAFREAHPNWDLQWVPVAATEWDAYLARVATILASGQQLDNIEIGTEGFLTFASSGITRPLDDHIKANSDEMQEFFGDVNPKLIEAVMYNGSLYNLPSLWAAAGIYYNKSLFDQAGLEYPTNDWTVEQFANAALAIRALASDVYGYAMPNRHWGGFIPWSFVRDTSILATEQAEGGDWLWDTYYGDLKAEERAERGGGYNYTASTANDPKNVEALQFLQDLAFKDDAMYVGNMPDIQTAFATGKLGMMVSHRAFISTFRNAGLNPDQYDVVYMPMWDSQKAQFGGSGLAITTLSQHPDEAWELLKYMTSASTQAAYIKGGIHTASRRSVTNAADQNEGTAPSHWSVYYDQLDKLPAYPIPAPPQNRDFTTIFTKYIGLAMANEMAPQDALDNMHTELNTLLGAS